MGTAASLGVDFPWSNSRGDQICGNIRTGRSQGECLRGGLPRAYEADLHDT